MVGSRVDLSSLAPRPNPSVLRHRDERRLPRSVVFNIEMRASPQEQAGGTGASEVSAAFERLGWGVAENARHDLGTDLFVMARDQRLFDLGLIVGVQVKAGPSYFREPDHDSSGSLLGWWFRDNDRSHIDAWLSHGLPHVLVLHDLQTRLSYWVHITQEVVVATGQGAKVRVPLAQTIQEEHRAALMAVAATPRPRVAWEGTAWSGLAALAPRDRLRHALLVPRLVAPHPNTGYNTIIAPDQAVALLVQARVDDLAEFASRHEHVPTIAEAATSPEWAWRFVGALGAHITTGDLSALLELDESSPTTAGSTAWTITVAAGLLEEARADEALVVLEAALARDRAEPVDQAWLTVQHARACAEIGRLDEARQDAVRAQAIQLTSPNDVTATAIAGVAAALLFNTSGWGQQDVADLITGTDTTASWWRTQTVSSGLAALASRTYRSWARDTAVTLGGGDPVNNQLIAASLTANYVGDHQAWRNLSALLGQSALMQLSRDSEQNKVRSQLEILRLAGDDKALGLAVRRVAADGPAVAITLEAANVSLPTSTRTTARADLVLLQYGGDLIDRATADTFVGWLLPALTDPSLFVSRTSPSYLLVGQLLDSLASVVPAASPSIQREVSDRVVTLPPQDDQFLATAWARVVSGLPEGVWNAGSAEQLQRVLEEHHAALRLPLMGVVARHDTSAMAELIEEAGTGALGALAATGDVRLLPTTVAATLVMRLNEQANRRISEAHRGSYGLGGHDVGHALALLNAWHPHAAAWDPLLELLGDRVVSGSHKLGALGVLAGLSDRLPEDVRARLRPIARSLVEHPAPAHFSFFGEDKGIVGAAAHLSSALGDLEDDVSAEQLVGLLGGNSEDRRWGARIARRMARPEDTGILLVLAQDVESEIRASAAAGLAALVAAGRGGAMAQAGLARCVRDPGVRVVSHVVTALAEAPNLSPASKDALRHLAYHHSAFVRTTATQVLST